MRIIKSPKILTSKEEIKAYCGGISDYMLKKYVAAGLPARYEDCRWIAHADNIDDFFKKYTRVNMKNIPEEMFENHHDENHVKQNST